MPGIVLGSAEEQTVGPPCHLALGLVWKMGLSTNRLQSVAGDRHLKGASTGDGRVKTEYAGPEEWASYTLTIGVVKALGRTATRPGCPRKSGHEVGQAERLELLN